MWTKRTSYYSTKKQGAYDSRFEAGYAQELELRLKSKEIKSFKAHVPIPLIVNGYKVCDYYIDFLVEHHDGRKEYVETKGMVTAAWSIKWKLFCSLFEDDENNIITLIMQGKGKGKPRKIKKVL